MVFLEWVGTGLLFFAHKMKFVARAYEYQAGSDRVCLYADSFLTLTTRGPICHFDQGQGRLRSSKLRQPSGRKLLILQNQRKMLWIFLCKYLEDK